MHNFLLLLWNEGKQLNTLNSDISVHSNKLKNQFFSYEQIALAKFQSVRGASQGLWKLHVLLGVPLLEKMELSPKKETLFEVGK